MARVDVGLGFTDVHEDAEPRWRPRAGAGLQDRWLGAPASGMEQRSSSLRTGVRAPARRDDVVRDAGRDEGDQRQLIELLRATASASPTRRSGPRARARSSTSLLLPRRTRMRRVLARRDMRRFLAGHTLSLFGDTAMWLALGVWAKGLTGSSAAAGMVLFFLAAPR